MRKILNEKAKKEDVQVLFVVLIFGAAAMVYAAYSMFVLAYGAWTWWAMPGWVIGCQMSRLIRLNPAIDTLCWVFVYPYLLGLSLSCF